MKTAKPANRRLAVIISVAILGGAVLGAAGYYLAVQISGRALGVSGAAGLAGAASSSLNSPYITPVSTTSSVIVGPNATSSSISSSTTGLPAPVDMSEWKTYSNYELGFSVQYPPDLNVDTSDPEALTLAFPSSYFSTQMADSDTFSVTVSPVCAQEQSYSDQQASIPSQTALINGVQFTENTQEGIGAGNYDNATIYQTNQNDSCYTIEFHSHAPDSGGLYTSDQSQIAALEAAHDSDEATINAVVSDMISTFAFINTPAGENEAVYSASQPQQIAASDQSSGTAGQAVPTAGTINLSSLSTSTVSVGGSLTLNGSGFLGHDTIVWISNGSVQGVLWGGMPSSDTSMTVPILSQACTQYTGASGAACPSYLILSTGVYTVSVSNQNGTTDPLYVRVQ